jgi:hypothetical protein
VANDTLIMVLETKRKSGGGDIVDGSVYMDRSTGKAVVAFVEAAGIFRSINQYLLARDIRVPNMAVIGRAPTHINVQNIHAHHTLPSKYRLKSVFDSLVFNADTILQSKLYT